ncbi:tetratricopeptide repeat protein [Sphingopyxis panaciterrulae]|uniref:Tetratricopeptide (TPR) repeat protein n=1 Tax=Sphingopyxis panaciterrulae TaxID=462372 RepID=A0A7W9B4M2_9SPHN|nr:tetratricopeptide repeat protein [Sphingopyxis panaciterrulae]MBB5706143.1 tetratricopeptide (TPR) repeat protein [Sphingopyxis panaciterrulae]
MRPLLILPALALLAACQPGRDASLDEAQRLYAGGQWADARIELMNLLKAEPANAGALTLMARIQIASGDGVGAAATLARLGDGAASAELTDMRAEADMLRGQCGDLLAAAPGKTPLSATLRRVRALCAIDGGDTGAAEKEVAAGLTDHPGDAGLQPVAARLAIVRGDLPEAERLIATARKAGGDGFEIEMVAGALDQRRANVSGALAHYAAAEKRNPLNSGPLAAQAELLAAIEDAKGLSAVVERLHRMAPQSPATAIAESRLALLRGDPRAAQEKLLAARQLAGDRPAIQLLAGRVAMALGNHDIAIAELSRYLGGGVRDEDAALMLASAFAATDDPGRAVATLEPLAARPDPSRAVLAALARHAKAAGQAKAAAGYAARAAKPSPARTANLLVRADRALAVKNWKGAILAYEALIEREGVRPDALILNNLGWAHFQDGQADQAITLLKDALKQAPDNASILDSLGWVLWSSGTDRAVGRDYLAKAHRLAPGSAAIKSHWEATNR